MRVHFAQAEETAAVVVGDIDVEVRPPDVGPGGGPNENAAAPEIGIVAAEPAVLEGEVGAVLEVNGAASAVAVVALEVGVHDGAARAAQQHRAASGIGEGGGHRIVGEKESAGDRHRGEPDLQRASLVVSAVDTEFGVRRREDAAVQADRAAAAVFRPVLLKMTAGDLQVGLGGGDRAAEIDRLAELETDPRQGEQNRSFGRAVRQDAAAVRSEAAGQREVLEGDRGAERDVEDAGVVAAGEGDLAAAVDDHPVGESLLAGDHQDVRRRAAIEADDAEGGIGFVDRRVEGSLGAAGGGAGADHGGRMQGPGETGEGQRRGEQVSKVRHGRVRLQRWVSEVSKPSKKKGASQGS